MVFDSLARLALVSELSRRFGYHETGVEDYLLVRRRIADWIELTGWHLDKMGSAATFEFASSGSTGAPDWTTHSLASLASEIRAILAGPLSDKPPKRILALVPPQHIYGFLWTVLLPSATGIPVVDVPAGLASSTFRKVTAGDLIVATPFGWDALGKSGQTLPDGVTGISSGGPTTSATWQAATDLGLGRLIEVYGATETGGIGWRDSEAEPFRLMDDVAGSSEGLARGPQPARRLQVQDRLDWVAERAFFVLGRHDTVVQVAGVNVNLSELEAAFCGATGATEVAIRLSGDRLKAFVAADRGAKEAALQALMRTLPAAARPDEITWGSAIPRTPEGKRADWS